MNSKLGFFTFVIMMLLASGGSWLFLNKTAPKPVMDNDSEISYIALGDSYTIGNGLSESDRWPNVVTKNLNAEGFPVRLIANPAVSGYTVEDALTRELPVVQSLQPDFVTVFIGANDNFRGKSASVYHQELKNLLDQLQSLLKHPSHIILITLPDYSKSPAARGYQTAGVSESIQEYNQVIVQEATERGLKVADIFPVSQTMTGEEDYISDGLHPSAQGAAKWERVIFPVILSFLQEKSQSF